MDFLRPASWEEALAAKAEHPTAVPIAGGTDVMVEINFDHRRPEYLMDLNRIGDLHHWEVGGESVRLGASVPYSGIMEHLRAELPGLALASRTVASPQIRNRGGVGGNLGTASPAGDAHPALLAADGRLTHVKARIVLDGGAYASASPAVVGNASSLGVGPYAVDDVEIEAIALCTNNPPCGAMRGFGAVQACFAYEAQMDKPAARLGMDPVELRQLNAMEQGTVTPTGQPVDSPAPVAELLRRLKAMPMPPERQWESSEGADVRLLPGGLSNTTHGEGVVRGVGYAVGIRNVGFSEGFDDYSTARVRVEAVGGEPVATVHTAMAEVGQGGVTVHAQIARTGLGVARVTIHPADTQVGSAGSTSASRQTYVTVDVLELADDHAPYGLRGVGEARTLSSTPAVLAAIRDATGLELNRTPVRPEHLTGTV
ncbi:hypothetical protein GCM10010266_29390 [Streptomyces griseomycini]|uniref:FAD binding domain-containing protein n=1 Tax=Streptomyces griseomycini TaxID=66895 RepID=UPI001873708B|nr:FAD binding domain-containing protein [Streptomyces griseomycini]GGQ03988.1 hypothetical protein GCM10010266_29390 [Streptomyces griseomycini]